MKPQCNPAISASVDIARILGACAIFYYHVGFVANYSLSAWGEYAVTLFIILSGLSYMLFSSHHPTDVSSYLRYMRGRLKTIFPIFISVNLAIYLASYFYASALGRPFTWVEFLLSASGLSQYFGFRYLSTVMWFIPFIIQAYVIFPAIASVLKRLGGPLVIALSFAISIPLVRFTFSFFPSMAPDICRNWSVIFRLPEVCAGIVLGQLICQHEKQRSSLFALILFVLLSLVPPSIARPQVPSESYILSIPWHGIVVTTAIGILAYGASTFFRVHSTWFLRLLGEASFPFYLGHGIGILALRRYADHASIWVLYFVICWALAVVASLFLRSLKHRKLPTSISAKP